MANFGLDFVSKGLPKIVAKLQTEAPVDSFLQTKLFPGTILGTEGVDGVAYDWRKQNPGLAEEAVRGADPNRVNYKSNFNSNYVVPNYYHDVDTVGLEDADHRYFGEDVEVNVDSHDRVTRVFADKTKGIDDGHTMAKEQMCADVLFNAQVVNKEGVQTFPMTASLLAQSGANLTTKFEEVISKAYENVRKLNKAFRATAIVLNPEDALNLVKASKDLLDKNTYNLGNVAFGAGSNGEVLCGVIDTPAGKVAIYAYYGVNAAGNNYIPKGKGLLLSGAVGSIAYGRVRAYENGKPCYRVQAKRMTAYEDGKGDMKHYEVEVQTAPIPVITNIDSYCVLTSIS